MPEFEARSDPDSLAKTIIAVTQTAKHYGVDVWLCYGALLGVKREGRLLPWNNDAELACWYSPGVEKRLAKLAGELNSKGFSCRYYGGIGCLNIKHGRMDDVNINCFWRENDLAIRPHELPSKPGFGSSLSRVFYLISLAASAYPSRLHKRLGLGWFSRDGVKNSLISILGLLSDEQRTWLFLFSNKMSRRFGGRFMQAGISAELFEHLETIDFYGSSVQAPVKWEKLLEYIYGASWKTPKDQWSFYAPENTDVSNIEYIDKLWPYEDTIRRFWTTLRG